MPAHIEMIRRDLAPDQLTLVEGIPTTTLARALLDCRDLVMGERLEEAARAAADRGLLRRREARDLLALLAASA